LLCLTSFRVIKAWTKLLMLLVLKASKLKVANMLLINDHMLDEVEVAEGVALEAVEVEAEAEVEKIPMMKITRIPKSMQRS